MISCYVAAPYADAERVRTVHDRMRGLGIIPSSRWAMNANGPEDLHLYDREQLREIARVNDSDVINSDCVLVLSREGAGAEMFCEARLALTLSITVYWVGRRILSSYRESVILCDDIDDALAMMVNKGDAP